MSERQKEADFQELAMPLGDHIEELRGRVLRCIVAVGALFVGTWFFRHAILKVLTRPHTLAMQALRLDPKLHYAGHVEFIVAQLKGCLLVAVAAAAPVLLYQMWAFIAPGLYKRERGLIVRLGLVSLLCMAAGVSFGYFLFIPLALSFLVAMAGASAEPTLMIGPYLSLFLLMTLALGVVFQTPLVMYHLVKWNIVSVAAIQEHRKVAILVGFIIGAVFTPPDPFTQIMMAVPLILLYDLGALAAAPSRRAVWNFARFAGTIAAILAAVAAFFVLWPVGQITPRQGQVRLASGAIETGSTASLRRGQMCWLPGEAFARLDFSRSGEGRYLLVAGDSHLQVHGGGAVSLYRGRVLADTADDGSPIEVRASAARVSIEGGRAELHVPESDTIEVNVLAGIATVRTEGRTAEVTAGRTATFHRGGHPTDTDGIEDWWRRRLTEGDGPDAE